MMTIPNGLKVVWRARFVLIQAAPLEATEVVIAANPSSLLDFSANAEFTLSAWVKAPAIQEEGGAVIAHGAGAGGQQYALDISGGAYRFFVRGAGGGALVLPSTVRPNGTWQHIVAVYSRTLKLQ